MLIVINRLGSGVTHNIYWHDDDTCNIIRIDISAPFTWDEYSTINLEVYKMMRTVDHRVDIIADMRESDTPADDKDAIQHIKRGRDIRPDHYGITVNVGTNLVTKTILDVGAKLVENHRKPRPLVNTIDEALAIIEAQRKVNKIP